MKGDTGASAADPFGIAGTIVDSRYRVERAVGQGGFGVVYRAQHLGFDSPIALKVLRLPEHWSRARREQRIASFQREGRVLFGLSQLHPSIVRAFETGTIQSREGSPAPYLALEWLEGTSLDRELKFRRANALAPWPLPQVLELLRAPCEGLAVAHQKGIAHRDIKPGNLFLALNDSGLSTKLLDFGIAKLVDETGGAQENLGVGAGTTSAFTPLYAAPEQWLERLGPTGTWTDVHALALVCVELLTLRPPLAGRNAEELMTSCLNGAVRPTPRSHGLELPPAIEAVFERALAREPRERFVDAHQFWTALRSATGWSPIHGHPVIDVHSLAAAADDTGPSANTNRPVVSAPTEITAATASWATRLVRPRPPRSALPSLLLGVASAIGAVAVFAHQLATKPSMLRPPAPTPSLAGSTLHVADGNADRTTPPAPPKLVAPPPAPRPGALTAHRIPALHVPVPRPEHTAPAPLRSSASTFIPPSTRAFDPMSTDTAQPLPIRFDDPALLRRK